MTTKKQFYIRLNPPRPTFAMDMTDSEKNIMEEHGAYWKQMQDKGNVVVFGPVFDPKGVFGVGIVELEDEAMLTEFEKNDPALKAGNTYEVYSMIAVTKSA